MILNDIAKIYSGCTYGREYVNKESASAGKSVKCLMKNSVYNGKINKDYLNEYYLNKKCVEATFTKKNDILFKLTKPHTAIIINDEETNYLVTNYYALIRCENNVKEIYKILNNKYMLNHLETESNCNDARITIKSLKNMPIGKETVKALSLIEEQQNLIDLQNNKIFKLLRKIKED